MSYRNAAFIIAIVFTIIRISVAIFFTKILVENYDSDYDGDIIKPCSLIISVLGIAAIIDIGMAFGCRMKKTMPLKIWMCGQFLVGGFVTCIFIPIILKVSPYKIYEFMT